MTRLLLCLPVLLCLDPAATLVADDATRPQVIIITSLGTIRAELFADEAPQTVANFIALAQGTKTFTDPRSNAPAKRPLYDGLTFHRVIKGFMIQGGDPMGNGSGGPGYQFGDEINAHALGLDSEKVVVGEALNPQCAYMHEDFGRVEVEPRMKAHGITQQMSDAERAQPMAAVIAELKALTLDQFYTDLGYTYDAKLPGSHKPVRGCLAMANSGPNTNGSQFFIDLVDTPHLTGKHTVFGQVIQGMDVVDAIGAVPVSSNDRPATPVLITSIRLAAAPGVPGH